MLSKVLGIISEKHRKKKLFYSEEGCILPLNINERGYARLTIFNNILLLVVSLRKKCFIQLISCFLSSKMSMIAVMRSAKAMKRCPMGIRLLIACRREILISFSLLTNLKKLMTPLK